MTEQKLPIFRFREKFIPLILSGEKTLTSRNRRYRRIYEIATGSRFKPKRTGITIRLVPTELLPKRQIANTYFREEGCASPAACLKELDELHADKDELWVHKIIVIKRPPR